MFNVRRESKERVIAKGFQKKLEQIRKDDADILKIIALDNFDDATENLELAFSGADLTVHNMFKANYLGLEVLKPKQRFWGVSAIINPDHWAHDPYLQYYKRVNYEQAARGVEIERIFILQNQKEIDAMAHIMSEQKSKGIFVQYVLEDQIRHVSAFPDFTVFPDNGCVLYVPDLNKLLRCNVSQDKKIVDEISNDFIRIKEIAKKWE
ncbi:MAG TPA: hypothetical protein DHW10_00860 [Rhodospirillaceae bacterium]|nr:hypothetical protein [Rhodospirillaceae bacterium]|tara:strand:- start:93 stop:716 length:624 start_codon:yes stop_codon:yes gene_type:complete